jgi:hypothetical protein
MGNQQGLALHFILVLYCLADAHATVDRYWILIA